MLGLFLHDYVALRAEAFRYPGGGGEGDAGQSALVGLFSPFCSLRPSLPADLLVLLFWWGTSKGWSKGEELYPVQGDGVFLGPVGQDVYVCVPRHRVQVHVAR